MFKSKLFSAVYSSSGYFSSLSCSQSYTVVPVILVVHDALVVRVVLCNDTDCSNLRLFRQFTESGLFK